MTLQLHSSSGDLTLIQQWLGTTGLETLSEKNIIPHFLTLHHEAEVYAATAHPLSTWNRVVRTQQDIKNKF